MNLPESDLDEATLARIAQETDHLGDPKSVPAEKVTMNELSHLLASIAGELKKGRWDKRIQALRRIQGILNGLQPSQHKSAATHAARLQDALTMQLLDLRSKVVAVAAVTIAHIGHVLGEHAVPLIAGLMPSLFKQAIGTNKVMASSAVMATQNIIKAVPSVKILDIILKQIHESKTALLKVKCAEYLLVALESWPLFVFTDIDAVCMGVRDSVMGSSVGARSAGQKSFAIIKKNWPIAAEKLSQSIGTMGQKRLRTGGDGGSKRRKIPKLSAMKRQGRAAVAMSKEPVMLLTPRRSQRRSSKPITPVKHTTPGTTPGRRGTPQRKATPRTLRKTPLSAHRGSIGPSSRRRSHRPSVL